MDTLESVEELRRFVIGHDLPLADMALWGIRCPYCGKSDRIRKLEPPEALNNNLDSQNKAIYAHLWHQLTPPEGALGVCKFCQNLLELLSKPERAQPLLR